MYLNKCFSKDTEAGQIVKSDQIRNIGKKSRILQNLGGKYCTQMKDILPYLQTVMKGL